MRIITNGECTEEAMEERIIGSKKEARKIITDLLAKAGEKEQEEEEESSTTESESEETKRKYQQQKVLEYREHRKRADDDMFEIERTIRNKFRLEKEVLKEGKSRGEIESIVVMTIDVEAENGAVRASKEATKRMEEGNTIFEHTKGDRRTISVETYKTEEQTHRDMENRSKSAWSSRKEGVPHWAMELAAGQEGINNGMYMMQEVVMKLQLRPMYIHNVMNRLKSGGVKAFQAIEDNKAWGSSQKEEKKQKELAKKEFEEVAEGIFKEGGVLHVILVARAEGGFDLYGTMSNRMRWLDTNEIEYDKETIKSGAKTYEQDKRKKREREEEEEREKKDKKKRKKEEKTRKRTAEGGLEMKEDEKMRGQHKKTKQKLTGQMQVLHKKVEQKGTNQK